MSSDAETPYDLVGVYRLEGTAAVFIVRLTLELDGRARVEHWMDFGGYWDTHARTTWSVRDGRVHLADRRALWRGGSASGLVIARSGGDVRLLFEDVMQSRGGRDEFVRQPLPWAAECIDLDRYGHALTLWRPYLVLEENVATGRVRVRADHGRLRWFPRACFG